MADVLVCKSNWNGVKSESFNWHNTDQTSTVEITQDGTSAWPFGSPSPISVGPSSKVACTLTDTPGTYTYLSNPCSTLGNPKTVIIT